MDRTNTGVYVRQASLADVDSVTEFNQAMALETEGKRLDLPTLRAGVTAVLQREGLGFYLLAETEQRVVGQLLITTEWSDWRNAYFWWIQSVYVDAQHRRRGIYRELYRHVVSRAKEAGDICGIRLYVDRDNTVAQQVYDSLGMGHSHYDLYEVEF